jgi:hypothetical protein
VLALRPPSYLRLWPGGADRSKGRERRLGRTPWPCVNERREGLGWGVLLWRRSMGASFLSGFPACAPPRPGFMSSGSPPPAWRGSICGSSL